MNLHEDLEALVDETTSMRRVPSFMSLDVEGDVSMANEDFVMSAAPEALASAEESSASSASNSNSDVTVATPVAAATPCTAPRTLLVAADSLSIENIRSVGEIEMMSGPLLRGYLKSVGLERKGSRAELLRLLVGEYALYAQDAERYLEAAAARVAAPLHRPQAATPSEAGSGRRTKKRSLKAREADDGEPPQVVAAEAALDAAVSPAVEEEEPEPSKRPRDDSVEPAAAARLARYEAIARQVVWARRGGADPPKAPAQLLKAFCDVFGFNPSGVPVSSGDQAQDDSKSSSSSSADPLGRRIEVEWMEGVSNVAKWYAGTCVKRCGRSMLVVYDDGEERVENLKIKRWRFQKNGAAWLK